MALRLVSGEHSRTGYHRASVPERLGTLRTSFTRPVSRYVSIRYTLYSGSLRLVDFRNSLSSFSATNLVERGSYLRDSYALSDSMSGENPARFLHVVCAGVDLCLVGECVGYAAAGRALRQAWILHGHGTCGSVFIRSLRRDAAGASPLRSRRTGSRHQPL